MPCHLFFDGPESLGSGGIISIAGSQFWLYAVRVGLSRDNLCSPHPTIAVKEHPRQLAGCKVHRTRFEAANPDEIRFRFRDSFALGFPSAHRLWVIPSFLGIASCATRTADPVGSRTSFVGTSLLWLSPRCLNIWPRRDDASARPTRHRLTIGPVWHPQEAGRRFFLSVAESAYKLTFGMVAHWALLSVPPDQPDPAGASRGRRGLSERSYRRYWLFIPGDRSLPAAACLTPTSPKGASPSDSGSTACCGPGEERVSGGLSNLCWRLARMLRFPREGDPPRGLG